MAAAGHPGDASGTAAAGHAMFAPSASAGWLVCPAYLKVNRQRADTGGSYAHEGTAFHTLMEWWLRAGEQPVAEGATIPVEAHGGVVLVPVDAEMLGSAAECVRAVEHLGGVRLYERRVDFSAWMPTGNQKGTCDFASLRAGKLAVRDWKYGKGVPVSAVGNTQLRLYALGMFAEHDELFGFEEIELGVCQPRLDMWTTETLTRDELLAWAEHARERARAAWAVATDPAARELRVPDDKACRWCAARTVCPARAAVVERVAASAFSDLAVVDEPGAEVTPHAMDRVVERLDRDEFTWSVAPAAALTTAQLARLLPYRKGVEAWFAGVAEELLLRAERGEAVPGFKLAETRSNREWADEETAERGLLKAGLRPNEFYDLVPISPAEAERLLRGRLQIGKAKAGKLLDQFVVRPPGRSVLVPAKDPRPALEGAAALFEAVDDGPDTGGL